ncbi:MAG: efflux RND transporter periplasmic adaptor subunit [Bacteroidales bacterium]
MKFPLSICLIISFLALSCRSRPDSHIITFRLNRSDFIESIRVEGTVQSVSNYPVVPPETMFGDMTVVRLAADGQYVKKGDTLCILSVPDLENVYNALMTQVETQEAGLKKIEADNQLNITMLEAQLATSEARIKMARLDSLKRVYARDFQRRQQDLEMQKAQIEKRKIEHKLAASRLMGETALLQARSKIIQAMSTVRVYESQLNSLILTADRDGMVMRTESPLITIIGPGSSGTLGGGMVREGSVIFMGTPVLKFPDMSHLQVSATVMETDYRRIEKGQKVHITVDAAGELLTTGMVNRKSLVGRTSQPVYNARVRFYEVIIDLDSVNPAMKPGLSAGCEIILAEVRDTLFVPAVAVFERDSLKTVYVRNSRKFLPVAVETGVSGGSYTIIAGGLRGDETIALSEPPVHLIATEKKKKPNKKDNLL